MLLDEVLGWFEQCLNFVYQLDTAFHFLTIAISIAVIYIVYRFLLAPIFGGSGSSDTVKNSNRKAK